MCRKESIRATKRVLNHRMEPSEAESLDFSHLNAIFKTNLGFGFTVAKILRRNSDNLAALKSCCFSNQINDPETLLSSSNE